MAGSRFVPVKLLDHSHETSWDAFVHAQADGTFFHLCRWRQVIESAFKHTGYYLLHEEDRQITGILPLIHVRSRLFSDALISTPFCVYGGILAANPVAWQALEQAAVELAETLQVSYLEMRQRVSRHEGWQSKDLYYTFRKPIGSDADANFQDIPRKQRAMIRKGMQAGLRGVVDADVHRFYRVYSESVRNLGTPVFSRRYLELLRETFGNACEIVTVLHGNKPVSSVMNFYFRDEILPYYGGGIAAARSLKANDFMYWEVMRRAADRGCRMFDFGRSKLGTGAYGFKHNWGFDPAPLHYRYRLAPGAAIPDHNPLNPKYRLFIAAWKRLPLPVATLLGPSIVRGLG